MNPFHNNRFLMVVIHLKNILAETCVPPDEGALCTWLGEEKPNQRDFFSLIGSTAQVCLFLAFLGTLLNIT